MLTWHLRRDCGGKRPRRNVCRRTDQKRICRENVSLVQTVRNGQQASDLLPMSGISERPVVLETGKSVSVSVNLSRLVARISIASIRSAFSLNYADATFTLDRIFLCNALEASAFRPAT